MRQKKKQDQYRNSLDRQIKEKEEIEKMKEKKEQELYQRLNGQRCLTPNILPIRDERNTIFRDFRYINEGNVIREKINIMEADTKREKNEYKKKSKTNTKIL